MDSVLTLFTYVFQITIAGAIVLSCYKLFTNKKHNDSKNNIKNLQAKISMIRISLKAKVKKKSHKFRGTFKCAITSGDPIDAALNELIENNFETGSDMQKYFDVSRRINSLLATDAITDAAKKKEKVESAPVKEDFMGSDFKSEMAIIRMIKEMVEISALLNRRIETYNFNNPKTPMEFVNPLNFPSLVEVNRVFVSDQNTSKVDLSEAA